tara:strand:- start:956 stop:1552 length:597 start_codon:yes stop_codon:yes gene_type:complete
MAKEDIVLGAGTLWYAPTATANPDETTVAYGAAWGGAWASLGDVLTPMVLSYADTRKAIKTQQSLGVIKEYRTDVAITLKTTLAEMTGANLALVLGGASADTAAGSAQKAFSALTVGNDVVVDTYKFGFETLRVDSTGASQPVRFFFHIGSIGPDGDMAFDKENETGVPVVITIYEDTSQSAGEQFMAVDIVTAAVTA